MTMTILLEADNVKMNQYAKSLRQIHSKVINRIHRETHTADQMF